MQAKVAFDMTIEAGDWPARRGLRSLVTKAVRATLAEVGATGTEHELSLVFTDDETIRQINAQWRGMDKPTNVLSFPPVQLRPGAPLPPLLGDIVLAWETVDREAHLEAKPVENHISHLIVHGLLHLIGHDHEVEEEAELMEGLERRVLARLAIPDPYA